MKSNHEFIILSKNICYLRARNGLSKKEMAKRLGIGSGTMSKIEKGILPPRLTVDILFYLQQEFDIPIKNLFQILE